jgi:hypothetical protein
VSIFFISFPSLIQIRFNRTDAFIHGIRHKSTKRNQAEKHSPIIHCQHFKLFLLSIRDHLISNHEPNHSRNVTIRSDRIRNVFSITMDALDNVGSTGENLERHNILTNLFSEPSFVSEFHFLSLFLSLLLLISTLYQTFLSLQEKSRDFYVKRI